MHLTLRSLPPLPTTDERIRRLQDADYCASTAHQRQRWKASFHAAGPELEGFVERFIREARKRQIPVHAEDSKFAGYVHVVHSQYGMLLQSDDWAVIGRIGLLTVSALCPGRIRWGGDSISHLSLGDYRPELWFVSEECPF